MERIDVANFTRAVEAVIDRHEILRTIFKKDENGNVRQWVKTREELNFNITHKDFRNHPDKKEEITSFIHQDSHKAFNLEQGPLITAVLIQIEEEEHIFYFNLHHITCDGWSTAILSKEILENYQALKENKTPDFKELPIQYKDYSSWQLAELESEMFKSHQKYWLNKLSGELPVLNLPTKKPRPQFKTFNGHATSVLLGADITSKLTAFSKQNGGSLFMTLFAVWNVLMYRYTGKKDLIIGTPVAGRDHADLVDQIGFYINTLALRNQINPEESFDAFYQTVKQNTLGAYSHQSYPFDRLVDDLQVKRDTSRNVLFDVLFTLQNMEENPLEETLKSNWQNWSKDKNYRRTIFDLQVTFQETGNKLSFEIVYNTDLYGKQMIDGIMQHYQLLLTNLLANPLQKIHEIEYLSEAEKQELLETFNDTALDFPQDRSIIDTFNEQVDKNPEKIAVIFENEQLTYQELDTKSNQLANYLMAQGVFSGDIVGLLLERSIAIPVAILGVLKSGAAYLPIDPGLPAKRIAYMLNQCKAKHILASKTEAASEIKDIAVSQIEANEILSASIAAPGIATTILSNAYCIFTSGSTGLPKGVLVNQNSILNLVEGLKSTVYANYKNQDLNVALVASYAFDASVQQLFPALLQGHTLYITNEESRKDGKALLRFYNDNKIDISDGTPTHLRFFMAALENDSELKTLSSWTLAGEALPKELVLQFHKKLGTKTQLYNFYGPTETCVDSLSYKIDINTIEEYNRVPIGKPLPNERVYVVDENGQLLPKGAIGELCIAGKGLAKGYIGERKMTEERFTKAWIKKEERVYRTGDLVKWLPDGNLEYIGRVDHQIKLRGYRIELTEIENVLKNHNGVEDATILVKEDENDKKLVACVVPDKTTAQTVRNVINQAKPALEEGAELYEMENGISLYSYNRSEVKMLYTEVFESMSYYSNGIKIPKEATIIDVGANVGSFSIFANILFENPKIYAFEPLQPTFKLLEKNIALYGGNIELFNIGISDKEEEAVFNFFPHATTLSGRESINGNIQEEVKRFIDNTDATNEQELTNEQVDELLDNRLKREKHTCKVKSLSQIIKENKINHIDLLKIDAENAELEIVNGIIEEDWNKIDQLIIEVFDEEGRLSKITKILEQHNFNVAVFQNDELNGTKFYNLYATSNKEITEGTINLDFATNNWFGVNALTQSVKTMLAEKLPDYMIPSDIILIENMPLTANGKLDKQALLKLEDTNSGTKTDFEAPTSETEIQLATIWGEVLKVAPERISVTTDFFELGGHSLNGIQIANSIKEQFGVTLKLAEIFNKRTIKEVAEIIEMNTWLDKQEAKNETVARKEAII